MIPIYSNPSAPIDRVPEYPQYYVLDVADLVEDFCDQWNTIVAGEVDRHLPQIEPNQQVYPEVYTIDAAGKINKQVYTAQHHQERVRPWHPDVSFIINHVIEAIKQRSDIGEDIETSLQLLEYDIATVTHHQLLPNVPNNVFSGAYSDTRLKLAKLSSRFGKRLVQRFAEFGLYKNGYFPYHFAGWHDACALVELDTSHR